MTTEGEYATRPWWRKEGTLEAWLTKATLPAWQAARPGEAVKLTEQHVRQMQRIIRERGTSMVAEKHDGDKPGVHLVWPGIILGMARVLTYGAKKYAEDQWMHGISFRRIVSAVYRHFLAILMGELIDEESGIEHIYHIATNVMFLAYYLENRWTYSKFDDLPYDVTRHTLGDKADSSGIPTVSNEVYERELENFLNPSPSSPDVTVDLYPTARQELTDIGGG